MIAAVVIAILFESQTADEAIADGTAALKSKQYDTALRLFREASALADDDARLRNKTLGLRARAAKEAKATAETDRLKELREADAVLESAKKKRNLDEKQLTELVANLDKAASTYRADHDNEHADLARAIRVLVSVRSGKLEMSGEAHTLSQNEKRGRGARKVALEALWYVAESQKDLEAAATSALELNALIAQSRPEDQRRYVRTYGLDALCTRYDAEKKSVGACARLEKKVTGQYTFTDLSRVAPKRELGEADIAHVHAQLLPAIEDCVLTAAKKALDAFVNTDVEIAWAIQPKGVVTDVEITPKRLRSDLESCVSERLSWARYPRYTSQERKAVRVPYHLDERVAYE